nr:hypothetical protein [Tanacetum cinerariifolium]
MIVATDSNSENTSFTSMTGSPGSIYQSEWGVTNGCRLDTPDACQDLVDHVASPGYFSELRHFSNDDFLGQENINLAQKVAMGSELRENEIKNLEALLKAEADMKKTTKAKNAELVKELESLHAQFTNLQVSNDRLSQQVSTLQAQVTGEERIKATFEEFKKYEDDRVEQRDNGPSIGHWARHAPCRMSEGLKYGIEQGKVGRDLADVEAYDPEANGKLVKALQDLKDLKYPMVDELERLKDALMELLMASLYSDSDTREDTPQWVHDLRLSSAQLKIPIYPEVRDSKDPWAVKEEMLLEDAITANKSRAEKKKKCRVIFRTYEIGSAHHARSDGVLVSVPTIVPPGLAILLADAATQTDIFEDE